MVTTMHSALTYTGFNLDDIKAMLTDHFGPGGVNNSWDAARTSGSRAVIRTGLVDITFSEGDTVHVKRTSILVEKK